MTITSLRNILRPALPEGDGVPAINVFNDLTLEGVLEAAVAERSPVIVQTSVKTVRSIGSDALWSMWASMTRGIEVPVALHLDHCPDRSVITECLRRGWNSVLFDASALPVEENLRQTIEVVAEARSHGAEVEGEIESITGVAHTIPPPPPPGPGGGPPRPVPTAPRSKARSNRSPAWKTASARTPSPKPNRLPSPSISSNQTESTSFPPPSPPPPTHTLPP